MPRHLFAAFSLLVLSSCALAQDLVQQAIDARAGKHYARAAALYTEAFEHDRVQFPLLVDAAGAYALAGDRKNAMATLTRAYQSGYTDAAHAEQDSELASLRADPAWAGLIAQMKVKATFDARLWNSPALATGFRDNISDDEKLAGLSKFWSEVKYNFVFVEQLKKLDWDALYLAYIPKVRATTSTAQFYRVLSELCAQLQDGHTNVYAPGQVYEKQITRAPLNTALVQGKVMVLDVFDAQLRADGVLRGVEITAIDGVPVKVYAEREVTPYSSASTQQDLDNRTYGFALLDGPLDVAAQVTFKDAQGTVFDTAVGRVSWDAWRKVRPNSAPFTLRMLDGDVAYVALNSFDGPEAADAFMAAYGQIAQSSALIIDLRDNGGGSSSVGYRVLATLTTQPFPTSRWSTRDYRPSYRAWGKNMPNFGSDLQIMQPDGQRYYAKPVLVLTAASTFSAAEDFAVAFDAMGRGRIVGEPTGGSTGQPLFITLPGGGRARICTKQDSYPDGRAFVGVGVQPGVLVHPTVADLRQGRDTVLQAALALLAEPAK